MPIRKRTCLVLGAGASVPYGFPTGERLKREIVHGLGDSATRLYKALQSMDKWTPGTISQFGRALGGSQQPSVDTFLANRLEEFGDIGRAAMATALIWCEREDAIRAAAHQGDWYGLLWQHMTSHGRSGFGTNSLSVVTFNYDRSLEWYLLNAYRHSFGCDLVEAEGYLAKVLAVVHVHGQLGELVLDGEGPGRPYTNAVSPHLIQTAADGIIILPQAKEHSEQFSVARYHLEEAEQVVFLGFGYHRDNLRRLGLDERPQGWVAPKLLGSSFGFTPRECQRRLARWGIQPGDPKHACIEYLRHSVDLD